MNFIKKQWIAFYLSILIVIMSIVSVAVYGVNSANNYFGGNALNGIVVMFTVFAIILTLAVAVIPQFFKDNRIAKIAVDVAFVLSAVFLAFALMLFVRDRVYYMAIVYGSDLEKGNQVAFDAIGQTIIGFVLYGITLVASIAAGFFNVTRKEIDSRNTSLV